MRIREKVSQLWLAQLDAAVLDLDHDSVVGARVFALVATADALLAQLDESTETLRVIAAVVQQIDVWYFG